MKHLKTKVAMLAGALATLISTSIASAATVFDFPFNEGSGLVTTDTVNNLKGYFNGINLDTNTDTIAISSQSPSGLPGDNSVQIQGRGYLAALDDTNNPVLALTNGPITLECWVNIDLNYPQKPAEGVLSYGNSYKLGLKGGRQVFTLFGKADITNTVAGFVPAGVWTHLAAAWEPGVGVTFYIDGNSYFVANTNQTARIPTYPYLSIGSEGPHTTNSLSGLYDRARIHNALLTQSELDSDAANPKGVYPSTVIAYDLNESNFPNFNAKSPSMPTFYGPSLAVDFFGPTWTNDTPTKLTNDFAFYFPSSKPVTVADDNNLITTNGVNGNYTLEAWVKLPVGFEPTNRMVMLSYPAKHLGFSFSINNNRTLHTTFFKKKDVTSTALVPNDGFWHHIAAVHEDGKEVRFYVDTQLRATTAYTSGIGTNTGASVLTIGQESATTVFRGFLDHIRFSNEALTPDQFLFTNAPALQASFTNRAILENQALTLNLHIANLSTFDGGSATVSGSATDGILLPPSSFNVTGSGADRVLTITPSADQNGWSLVSVNANDGALGLTETFALTVLPTNTIALWNFNSETRDITPATGSFNSINGNGTAAAVGLTDSTFGTGMTPVADLEPNDNSRWRMGTFPAASTGNKTAGAEFHFSTVGFQNIQFTWEHWNSNTGSKYWRVQYALDGVNFQDHTVYAVPGATNTYLGSVSFAGIAGANNNPNFAVRFVSEFAGTATGQVIPNDNYAAARTGSSYGTAGTLWMDMAKFTGEPYSPVASPATLGVGNDGNGGVVISWDASVSGTLEGTSSLSSPNWQPVGQTPQVVGGKNVIVISNPAGTQFYRLHQQ